MLTLLFPSREPSQFFASCDLTLMSTRNWWQILTLQVRGLRFLEFNRERFSFLLEGLVSRPSHTPRGIMRVREPFFAN
jgi:hypothetical protein